MDEFNLTFPWLPSWFFHASAIQEKLKEQIKDVEAEQAKEVPLSWVGVAEVSYWRSFFCIANHVGTVELRAFLMHLVAWQLKAVQLERTCNPLLA